MGGKYIIVGRFFGIQLRIHYSWFVIFTLVAWVVITSYIPTFKQGLSPLALVSAGLIVTVIFFASVIAHEYAHSIVANRRGLEIKRITLFVFGGASELEHEPDDAKTELLMTAAGPATSLAISGIFACIWILARHWNLTALEVICQPVAALNLTVAIFNLLPAFPLDGGRLLRSIIWLIRNDYTVATKSATNAGIVLSYLLVGFGLLEVFAGYFIGGTWLAIIGFFLNQSARMSYRFAIHMNLLGGVKVRDVSDKRFVAVPAGTEVSDFLANYVLTHKHHVFIAVDENKTPIGVIDPSRVIYSRFAGPDSPIQSFVQDFGDDAALRPSDTAAKALRTMQTHNSDVLPVVSRNKIIGVVARKFIEDYIVIHRLQQPIKSA